VAEGNLARLDDLEQKLVRQLAEALGVGSQAVEEARHPIHTPLLAAQEKLALGRLAFVHGSYEHAAELGAEALELDPEYPEAMGFVGVCYARMGQYDDAERQHRRQEVFGSQWHDDRLRVEALANLGVMYYFRSDYDAAGKHYAEAARLAGSLGLRVEQAQIWNNLGFVLFRQGRPAEAERAFLSAIEIHRAYGGLAFLANPYNGMGNVQVEQGRFDEGRWYYQHALVIATEMGDRATIGSTHMHLGRCAASQQRFTEAKDEFTMALNAFEETRFSTALARAYEYMTDINLQLGDYDEAICCADKRVSLARQHANARMEAAAWMQKAESLKRAGRTEEAAACLALGQSAAAAASA
jgi:tetratricopeptide (TPR) repeat protein